MSDSFAELVVVETKSDIAPVATARIIDAIKDALDARGTCSLCLAGGSTPRPIYQALAARADIDWDNVHVYFGDERCVAPDHPDSNYKMARESLLDTAPIPPSNVHRMEAEREDRDAAADAYATTLPERIDVMLLGMGEDAHTASLFPGKAALDERARRVIPVIGPKPPPWRLTLTASVIEAARLILVLTAGAGKAEALAEVFGGTIDIKKWPVQLAAGGTFIVDEAAAALIKTRG